MQFFVISKKKNALSKVVLGAVVLLVAEVVVTADNLLMWNPSLFLQSPNAHVCICSRCEVHEATAHELDPNNMLWAVVQRFHEEWKAIVDKKKKEIPDTPKLTKGLPVHKWLESVRNHLNQVIGVRFAPLSYVIRENANVDPVPPPS